jgi:hypothetical protein
MTNPENAFLTDNRRDVLNGESDWSDQAISNEKSRIKNRADLALDELIEVAQSPRIDNSEVFDPDTMSQLLSALLIADRTETQGDGVQGGLVRPDDYTDEFRDYSNKLKLQMAKFVVEEPGTSE